MKKSESKNALEASIEQFADHEVSIIKISKDFQDKRKKTVNGPSYTQSYLSYVKKDMIQA